MQQQTAIEWLHEIAKQREPDKFDWEQAKQMEANQSDRDYQQGFSDGYGIMRDMIRECLTIIDSNNNTQ